MITGRKLSALRTSVAMRRFLEHLAVLRDGVFFNIEHTFARAFAKLQKSTVSFVMPVRSSVRMEKLGSHWTDFN
jgi:hypothetical protein